LLIPYSVSKFTLFILSISRLYQQFLVCYSVQSATVVPSVHNCDLFESQPWSQEGTYINRKKQYVKSISHPMTHTDKQAKSNLINRFLLKKKHTADCESLRKSKDSNSFSIRNEDYQKN